MAKGRFLRAAQISIKHCRTDNVMGSKLKASPDTWLALIK